MRAAIWLTWPAVACGRSAGRRVMTRTPGVVGDAPVGDGFAHQQAEQAHDARDAGVGELAFELLDEQLDRLPGDLVERGGAERGQDVDA
jgi:hypothetical protein